MLALDAALQAGDAARARALVDRLVLLLPDDGDLARLQAQLR